MVAPVALAWADTDNLLYLDMGRDLGGRIRRINMSTGTIETVAGGGRIEANSVAARDAKLTRTPGGLAVDSRGNVYIGYETAGRVDRIDAQTGLIAQFAGGGDSLADGVAPRSLALLKPMIIRVDAADNVYILDTGLHAVFRVDARTGVATRIAGTPGSPGHSGDGGPATAASLNSPTDIAADAAGNLYIADRDNHVIRFVEARSGAIDTFAGMAGASGFKGDGGDKVSGKFRYPQSLLLKERSLLVADRMNHRIRSIDLDTGVISTIAGSGRPGHAGENVPALEAGMFEPLFMLPDGTGGLLVAAARSRRIYQIGNPVSVPVPWWRSGWAFGGYLAALGLLILLVIQVRTRALRAQTVVLESSVKQRSREIEEQKALIERQAMEFSALVESKDRLMARISHEFRTPLTVILGPIARLLEQATDGPFKESLATTQRHTARLLRLVEQLLSLVRLSHGYLGPVAPVAAGSVIRRAVAAFESLAIERGVALRLGRIADIDLQANKEALEAMVAEVVANALKFTSTGGQVCVALHDRGDMAEIEVTDSGCGIDGTRLGRLFETISSESPEEGAERDATGLGLALVGQLVAAQAGTISVASEAGKGTCVRIRLPRAVGHLELKLESEHQPADATPGARAPSNDASLGKTVLVIEDNDDMREYLRQLIALQYRCLVARDGEHGLELARAEIPDLVVCDVMLPHQDGISVCRALKGDDRTSHVPVLLLTALQEDAHKLRGLEAGPDDYLGKPFDEAELLQRIGNLLEIRSLLRQRFRHDLRVDQVPASDLTVRDQAFLVRLGRVAEARHAEADFDVGQLAATLAMSDRQLQRKVRALLGVTPAEYLRSARLQHALQRLNSGERPSDVALAVGFSSHAYFTTCFKAHFGYTPAAVRGGRAAADVQDDVAPETPGL